jgi:type I restriction enzyme S subunit
MLISWSATLGAYIWDGPEGVLNQHIFKVRSKIDQRLHYHLVRHKLAELLSNAHGSGMVHVTKGVFDATPVKFPSALTAQRELARQLDAAEEKRARVVERLESATGSLTRLRQAILASACSGRLTADWRPRHPDLAGAKGDTIGSTSRRARSAATQPSVELELPDLPATYGVGSIGGTSTVLDYGTSERAGTDPDSGVPVLRMGNIQDGRLDLSDLKFAPTEGISSRLYLKDRDLLFNRTNSPELVGKSAVFRGHAPTIFASYLIRVRFDPDIVDSEYANFWINSAWGRAWASLAKTDGVSQSNINGTKLAQMPIPLPPIEEQRTIVLRASQMLAAAEKTSDQLRLAGRRAESLAAAVLSKALD